MGAENLDPLGLGRIDTRQLALVSCACLLSPTPLVYRMRRVIIGGNSCTEVPHDKVVCPSVLYVTCMKLVMSLLDSNISYSAPQIRSEHRVLGRAKSMAVRGPPATKVPQNHTCFHHPEQGGQGTSHASQLV